MEIHRLEILRVEIGKQIEIGVEIGKPIMVEVQIDRPMASGVQIGLLLPMHNLEIE